MRHSKITTLGTTIPLCAGLAICFLAGCRRVTRVEEARVTSPDSQLDAVVIRESYGGALGGFEWNVFIVPKGNETPTDNRRAVFQAPTLTAEKLVWNQAHLLEIHYDVAHIERFRNLWGLWEVRDVGSRGERDYEVEIRLVPSSPDFSILTPNGSFRN